MARSGRARGWRALSVPEQIVCQHAEVRRERRELPLPHRAVEPETVNQRDCRPVTVQFPSRFACIGGAHWSCHCHIARLSPKL